MAGKICVGAIFKKFDEDADHPKYHIIIGDKSGDLGTIFINTDARYSELAAGAQASQLPISTVDFAFLDHDSFADCSTIKTLSKSKVNELLQKMTTYHLGYVPANILAEILRILKLSKVVEKEDKRKYGLE